MLDIKLIRSEPDRVKQGIAVKGFDAGIIDDIIPLDTQSRELQLKIEELRSERNKLSAMGPHTASEGKKIKEALGELEKQYTEINDKLKTLLLQLPNLPTEDTPIGEDEQANTVIRKHGTQPQMDNPLDHVALGETLDLIDSERGVKVAESRFTYLKNQAVLLEFALVRFALDIAMKHGFTPMVTPVLVNEKTVMGTGYLPHGADEVYKTQDDLYLIGTSELPLVAYHTDEILTEHQLPKRYVGFSSCFRREAGTYGKDTRGIIRLHQFDKVELVSLVKPEDSDNELEKILAIEEEIVQALELSYQVVQIGSGDLGIQAAKKYDIETWMPGQNKYRETHSCSNTTDFQSRRLNIRFKTGSGENIFVHTLNGTAVAIGRMLVAILENGQEEDGSIIIPPALTPYSGFSSISKHRYLDN